MLKLRNRRRETGAGGQATEKLPQVTFDGGDRELADEIRGLTDANRATPDHILERRLLALRNIDGIRRLQARPASPRHPEPAALPTNGGRLPEIGGQEVTPQLLRAGILTHGCLLVRGLVPREEAVRFAEGIERAFMERERRDRGQPHDEGLYSEFVPDPQYGEALARDWIKEGGGVLAVDSPHLFFEMREMFDSAGVLRLAEQYLGEPPLITAQKSTLRKAEPSVPGGWHQDGKFMGEVRALNLWLSLSRCGDEAPGLDIIPRRFEELVKTHTEEALLDYIVSQRVAEAAAGEAGTMRPIFEPGDALLFDDLFLHKTGSDQSMSKPRYAIENWFFGASSFPADYSPVSI